MLSTSTNQIASNIFVRLTDQTDKKWTRTASICVGRLKLALLLCSEGYDSAIDRTAVLCHPTAAEAADLI